MSDSPNWYDARNELEAVVDLDDVGFGTFHIVDANYGDVARLARMKASDATGMSFAAYMGDETETPTDKPDWPAKDAPKSEWSKFVESLTTKVVTRITKGINLFAGVTSDPEDESGN